MGGGDFRFGVGARSNLLTLCDSGPVPGVTRLFNDPHAGRRPPADSDIGGTPSAALCAGPNVAELPISVLPAVFRESLQR